MKSAGNDDDRPPSPTPPPEGGKAGTGEDRSRSGAAGPQDEEDVPSGLKTFFGGSWRETSRYVDAASGLIGGLLGLGLIGWLLDLWLGTQPRLLLLGLLLGGAFGFYRLGRAMLGRR